MIRFARGKKLLRGETDEAKGEKEERQFDGREERGYF